MKSILIILVSAALIFFYIVFAVSDSFGKIVQARQDIHSSILEK